jgi:HSP20 family molecular chaperone IbpA
MAEIQNRNADRAYIREIQQDKNARKKELAEQQREDIKQIKTFYAEKNREIDDESAAAINHIKTEQTDNDQAERQAKVDERRAELEERRFEAEEKAAAKQSGVSQSSVYNREGRLASSAEKKSLKPEPQVEKNSNPENDSFYKVQDRGSKLSESHDGYYIKAYAPEKEKDNIRVSIMNDKAVISGKRKFQDSKSDESKTLSTNNFQTYREEFKFERPVSTQGMTRERDGDYMRYFIPKLETVDFDEEA